MPTPFPYSVPERRSLNSEERQILAFLIQEVAPDRLGEVAELKVVARCGCGKCPTVLFGRSLDDPPLTGTHRQIASYRGVNTDGVDVGVVLLERKGVLSELEAWSPTGDEIRSWPPVDALQRFLLGRNP
jgi:hypothetical protein